MSFDPYGDGLGENNQLAYLAIDGNPATAWHTEWYSSASFGGLKPGTGLLLDMGRTVTISTVRLLLGDLPGADFQVSVGAVASSLTVLPSVARASDAGGQVSLHLTSPARGRYVLIWFTQLPPAMRPPAPSRRVSTTSAWRAGREVLPPAGMGRRPAPPYSADSRATIGAIASTLPPRFQ